MRVRIDSIGCRLNIGEAEQMARRIAGRGHRIVGPGEPADLYVFNSCAVTHVAARKSRKLIRQLRRASPSAAVVVTGCYAELSCRQVEALGVDLIVSNRDKDDLPQLLERAGLLGDGEPIPDDDASPLSLAPDASVQPSAMEPEAAAMKMPPAASAESRGRTRAFVKVQDGCDNRCTFCIVTVARGEARSRPIEEVVAEIEQLVDLGYQEVVLSGVHLGSWGHDLGNEQGLRGLVEAILRGTRVPRLRLSSLEPWDLDEEFFGLWQDRRLLPHLHLPLQSGCDTTLRRMARRTDQRSFATLLEQARAAIPDLAVTTDLIVGFAGETEAEFADSLAFVEQTGFARLHVFRYSARAGTAAAALPAQVSPPVARHRSARMHELGASLERDFRRRFLGRTLPVLWETSEPHAEGLAWSGLTGNYLRVVTFSPDGVDLGNCISDATLIDQVPGALVAVTPEWRGLRRWRGRSH